MAGKKAFYISFTMLILAILLLVIIILLNYKWFLGVYNVSIFMIPCIVIAVVITVNMINKKIGGVFLIISGLILLLIVAGFVGFMPKYNVNIAIKHLAEKPEFKQVQIFEYARSILSTPRAGLFVNRVYCFQAYMDSKPVLILFNPVDGEYLINDYDESKWVKKFQA